MKSKRMIAWIAAGLCTVFVAAHGAAQAPRRRTAPRRASAARRGPGAFAGSYALTSNTTVQVTSPMAQTETRTTHETAVVSAVTGADMVFDVTSDTGDHCVLNANRVNAAAVSFVAGQRCDVTDPVRSVRLSLTLVDGTGTLRGDALSIRLNWSVEGGAFIFRISGTAVQRSSGTRR